MDIFKDSSVVEQELITYRENGGDKVGISLTVCSSYDGVEIILSEDELLGAHFNVYCLCRWWSCLVSESLSWKVSGGAEAC